MDKFEFLIRQIAKTNKKNYENYVITRIWHWLNNLDIKFVTQQYVAKKDGSYALTDMYFPQLGLHVEIDESHHRRQVHQDQLREQDIISITNHQIERVNVSQVIELIHAQIELIVDKINKKVIDLGDQFVPWDLERETSHQTYIDLGYIDVKDDVAFKKIVDACNCFGYNHIGFQRGGIKHPFDRNTWIWFPKLYPNKEWDNRISPDEKIITEKHTDPIEAQKHIKKYLQRETEIRIVFAKVKGPLGDIMYRFKGVFKLDTNETVSRQCLVWKKIADQVKTYPPKDERHSS